MKAVLCDIEGTTTDINFVKDTLFPIARDNVEEFLKKNFEDAEIQTIIEDYATAALIPIGKTDKEAFIKAIVSNVHLQMREDQKTKELKRLQGKIWKEGFESGTIKGHVYDDVPTSFEKWLSRGLKIFIYSSGSVEAQKLLFENSVHGNLLKHLSGHFDTCIGHKQESQSYKNIAETIQFPADKILFLTDVPNEARAAEEAGMDTFIIDRPCNPLQLTDDIRNKFKVVKSFDEIDF